MITEKTPLGQLLSVAEAAERLGMKARRLRRVIAAKKIRFLHDGAISIYERWCDEFIEKYSTAPRVRVEKAKAIERPRSSGLEDLMPPVRRFAREKNKKFQVQDASTR